MIKGKVVLVPFPFDDLQNTKVRPAVCLTEPTGLYRHIVLAFISSQVPSDLQETDLVINPQDPGFAETGLRVSSLLRLHRLMTVTASIIQRELGILSEGMQKTVDKKLHTLFGLK